MSTSFLFRFDGSRDNDDYLEQGRARGYIVFAGIEMRVNAGWVPDFMRVVLDEPTARCTLTLVELEADANSARVSARKYLPESASSIVEGFLAYLERTLAQCRATADPRHKSIHELITTIRGSQNIAVTTAGALRNRFVFIEELPLIDQAPVDVSRPSAGAGVGASKRASGANDPCAHRAQGPFSHCSHPRRCGEGVGQKRCLTEGVAKSPIPASEGCNPRPIRVLSRADTPTSQSQDWTSH